MEGDGEVIFRAIARLPSLCQAGFAAIQQFFDAVDDNPELPRDPSLSAELDGLVDSRPGVERAADGDEDDEEDAVAETMGVGETPAMGVELLSNVTSPSSTGRRLASSPSQLSWSISNTGRPARIAGTSGWLVLGLLIAVASVELPPGLGSTTTG